MSKSGRKSDPRNNEEQQEKPEFEHIGQYLQQLRTEKGLSVKEVADSTRISEVNLIAIEAQDFTSLPADTFTRGLLTIYAEFLELDPAETVQQFLEERDSSRTGGKRQRMKQQRKILTPKTLAEPPNVSSITTAVILLVAIVALFTAFCLYTSWNPFSFITDKENSFQSIMMSVLPGSESGTKEPLDENMSNEQPPPEGTKENNIQAPDSAPNSFARPENTVLVTSRVPAVMKRSPGDE